MAILQAVFVLLSIQVIRAYDFYLEGYAMSNLSFGNGQDSVLITDTNRYADGITSISSYEITSPHFPYYFGPLLNTQNRYLQYTKYMSNAADQGIAGYGDGEKVQEDAKILIISKPNYQQLPAPTITFPVYAAVKWNPSNFAIQAGETYNISVFPALDLSTQMWYDGGLKVDANGYSSSFDPVSNCYVAFGACRSHLKKNRRLPSGNWMSLVCAIGQFIRNVNAIQVGKEDITSWVPLDESSLLETIFYVGESIEFTAIYSGQLICFANDGHSLYFNNRGYLNVTATRISWPPSNEVYYRPFEVPSCSSAYAVYNKLSPLDGSCNPNDN